MPSYCLNCRKNTETKNLKFVKTKNGKIIFLSKCAVCDSKKLKLIQEQEPTELLSSSGIRTTLSQIPLLSPLLF